MQKTYVEIRIADKKPIWEIFFSVIAIADKNQSHVHIGACLTILKKRNARSEIFYNLVEKTGGKYPGWPKKKKNVKVLQIIQKGVDLAVFHKIMIAY